MRAAVWCPQSVEWPVAGFLAWSDPPGEPRLTPASEVPVVSSSPLMSADHLDLLATAAVQYRVVALPPAALLSGSDVLVPTVTAAHTGRILRQHNVAAGAAVGQVDPHLVDAYTFQQVQEPLDPVEVVKACHCFEDACRRWPLWERSVAAKLIRSLERAAMQRIPGYTDAPWRWVRSNRNRPPVGFATSWRPAVPGLEWVSADELRRRWDEARVVVVTTQAVPDLPPGLPRRPAVIGLHDVSDVSGLQSLWAEPMTDAMVWPVCAQALQVALNEPREMLL